MLHNAVGSMPATPEEEKIETPVEETNDEQMNELSDDVPSTEEETNGPAANEDELSEPADNAPEETEADPDGEEPVTEPINE